MSSVASHPHLDQRLAGLLLGTAVGDALGLPAENLSPGRIRRRWPGPLRMRLVFGRGMVSDDTEHTLMVAQALLSYPDDPVAFQRSLGWKLRWWFAALPAGVGLATAKACLRLWLGIPANRAGLTSAGSRPAMRSALLGAYFAGAPNKRRDFVLASSRLTHRGWQAETAALAVAEAAALATTTNGFPEASHVFEAIRRLSDEQEWQDRIVQMESCLKAGDTVSDFVQKLGLTSGVTGYSLDIAPVALYVWLRHRADFRSALSAAIQCGGDTDTVGAVLGALCGTVTGTAGIPSEWINGLWEWPRSRRFMAALALRLTDQGISPVGLGPARYFWPGLLPRNLLFLAVVLAHGFRRLTLPD
jgi:ADP-ribosyl-[dinitrogen reductase] hydrolase